MKIARIYYNLEKFLEPNKVLVIFGPRQAGKTTLVTDFLQKTALKYRIETGDNLKIAGLLSSLNFDEILNFAEGFELIVIDEAQRINNIGQALKILVDNIPNIKIIVTGSSSFELAGQVGEPLTGRKRTMNLFPVSQLELKKIYNDYDLKKDLDKYLVYGSYPAVVAKKSPAEKIITINEITESYLLKDIVELDKIKNSKVLLDLLRLLAFQVGSEVSLSELGRQLGIDYKTVARYLDLFEKSFVIYNLRGYSRNLRKEITKKSKYYFFDNGVLNSIINNFNPLETRNDVGKLWENFIFMERMKKRSYLNIFGNDYFWRTWDGSEVDLIEEREGKLFGYEIKWGNAKKIKAPKDWINTYSEAEYEVINQDNYLDFIA